MIKGKKLTKEEMMAGIKVGQGATYRCGSDSYPYYVTEVNGFVVGTAAAKTLGFEHDWTDGAERVAPFEEGMKTESYRTIYRGGWYECDKDGNLTVPHRKAIQLSYSGAYSYRDPSF